MKSFTLFKGLLTFYTDWQEYPKFRFHWRWRTHKGTFEVALILFGRWFGIIIDHDIFYEE